MRDLGSALSLAFPAILAALVVLGAAALLAYALRGRAARWADRLTGDPEPASAIGTLALAVTTQLLVLLAATQILATAGFLLGVGVGPWALLGGALTAAGTCATALRALTGAWRPAATLVVTALTISLLAGSAALTVRTFDLSTDGQWYHQQAVIDLAGGWNPLRVWENPYDPTVPSWTSAYPKGPWLEQAALYGATDRIESAKFTGVPLIVAAFLAWVALALSLRPRRPGAALAIAALAALNPIAVVQALTFMVDGRGASLTATALALGGVVLVRGGGWPTLLGLACALMLLATTKFTGVAVAVILGSAFIGVVVLRRPAEVRLTPVVLATAAALVAGTVGAGFNPYVTNTLLHGSPAHPIAGRSAVPVIIAPPPFDEQGRLASLAYSLVVRSADMHAHDTVVRTKVPFAVSIDELRNFAGAETLVGGFGPWFGGATLLALALAAAVAADPRVRDSGLARAGLALCGLVLVTVLVNPAPWYARLVPQLWLVPVSIAGVAVLEGPAWSRAAGRTVWTVLALNLLMVALVYSAFANLGNRLVTAALEDLRADPAGVILVTNSKTPTEVRLAEHGIDVEVVHAEEYVRPEDGEFFPYAMTIIERGAPR